MVSISIENIDPRYLEQPSQRESDEIKLRKEQEDKFKTDHPFHPTIQKYTRISQNNRYSPARNRKQQHQKECPFTPQLHTQPRRRPQSPLRVTDRLIADAKARQEKLAVSSIVSAQLETENCTFHPQTISSSLKLPGYVPIEHRTPSILKQQRSAIEQKHFESENEFSFKPHISSESRRLSAQNDRSIIPVGERLYQDAFALMEHTQKLEKEKEEKEIEGITFKPHVDGISKAIVEDGKFFERQNEALKKKKELEMLAESGAFLDEECTFHPLHSFRRPRTAGNPKCLSTTASFSHHLSPSSSTSSLSFPASQPRNKSNLLTGTRGSFSSRDLSSARTSLSSSTSSTDSESFSERVSKQAFRLSVLAAKEREDKILSLKQQEESAFSFQPKIDRISALLARSKTVDELSSAKEVEKAKKEAEIKVKREEAQKCTFRPKLNSKVNSIVEQNSFNATTKENTFMDEDNSSQISKKIERYSLSVRNPSAMMEKIAKQREEQALKMAEERKKREYEVLKECTFQPTLVTKERSSSNCRSRGRSLVNSDTNHELRRSRSVSSLNSTQATSTSMRDGRITHPPTPVVRGMGRYLELKEMAQKKKEEEINRMKKVFKLNGCRGMTISDGKGTLGEIETALELEQEKKRNQIEESREKGA
ncbi:uncharacterized protein MONOS_5120 [Monocercomonoides exilis]|uniref:uncharacterized protein n=1 Tax=Monocercomonoides exilis TaxID=2049356 RepID=UPI00355A71FD|nr:hypothetical protein MONOS_5120 [Monocercomonoides exilis]|eukprot:MONOS_5120.1-p1 / transcript=MONOS_5120.1 / gene=MONOS_5120 / organism=Monocercomonoides_exilis_PA203 / gene_product=unspecified product / transcript_product=unspecified product / location=Mono_scaffold00145:83920-85946(+) / protein_length=652 / sequence_SO=supercontig / SO=protein_coding / is_pseudo=false